MLFICDNKRHLVCLPYSVPNLHKMADELHIARCWFHKDHYDIPKSRVEDIRQRCFTFNTRDIVKIKRGVFTFLADL